MKKKLLSTLLCVSMVAALFVGCGSSEEPAATETPAAEEVTEEATEETATEFSYPMDGKTVSVSSNLHGQVSSAGYDSVKDTEFAKALDAATGISVDFWHPTGGYDEWFNFLLADGEYPDIMDHNWGSYPGGLSGAYADGIAIELNDVIDQYMPNFKAWIEENPELAKLIITDDGKYYGIPAVTGDARMGGTAGMYIRQDMLEEMGETLPTTIDGWHDLLVKVKETYNITPIVCDRNILWSGALMNAYCPSNLYTTWTLDSETGKVEYTQATEEYKEYLSVLAQWYDEGLIDKDFATLDGATVKAKILNNEAFMSWGWAGSGLQTTMMEARETNPEFTLAPVGTATVEEGAKPVYNSAGRRLSGTYAVITTNCEDVEAAARWLDFFWSEEGIMLSNFGVEGVSYTMENGVPTYTDEIINNPDGLSLSSAMGKYIYSYRSFPGIQDYYYLEGYYQLPTVKEALSIWGGNGSNEYEVPTLNYTEEENSELTTILPDINTLASEMTIKFVIGTEDIETEWDTYMSNMESYGLSKAIEINQAAYERLQAR